MKQVEGRKIKGNMHMTSGVVDKRQPISCQSKRQARYGSGKPQSRVQQKSDKGQNLIACSYTNIPTYHNMYMGKDAIRLKK